MARTKQIEKKTNAECMALKAQEEEEDKSFSYFSSLQSGSHSFKDAPPHGAGATSRNVRQRGWWPKRGEPPFSRPDLTESRAATAQGGKGCCKGRKEGSWKRELTKGRRRRKSAFSSGGEEGRGTKRKGKEEREGTLTAC